MTSSFGSEAGEGYCFHETPPPTVASPSYYSNTSRQPQCHADVASPFTDPLPGSVTLPPVTTMMQSSQSDSDTLSSSSLSEVKMFPISATDFQRYERGVTRPKNYNSFHYIRAKTTSFSSNPSPIGWTPLIHPEGASFFHHGDRRIFTDANLYDKGAYMALEEFAVLIESRVEFSDHLPESFDIVLDLRSEGPGRYTCGYYFANHHNRTLFWLDDHDVSGILNEVNVSYTSSHIAHEIESQYWYHCELFPNTRSITLDMLLELKDVLIHSVGDSLTSSVSNAPYNTKQLQHMLHLVDEMKDQVDRIAPGSVCTFSRLMGTFAHERFLNLHGEPEARLCRDQSIHDDDALKQTSIFRCINPVMFYVPSIHLRTLRDITIDHLANKSRAFQALTQFKSEWRDSSIFSALLLNANAVFLIMHNNFNPESVSQRMNLASILANIGSLIAGLLLSRQAFTGKFHHFLAQRSTSSFGLESLAMMYSLPNALLLWGAISFFAALGMICIEAGNILSYLLIGVAWTALIWIFIWCISTSSESGLYVKPWIVRKLLDQHHSEHGL